MGARLPGHQQRHGCGAGHLDACRGGLARHLQEQNIFGKYRIAVGGNEGGDASVENRRKDTDVELVFFMAQPREFYQAIIGGYFLKAILDLTPGNGACAEAALLEKVGYWGLCLSELHAQCLRERLVLYVLKAMMDEKSGLYEPQCAAELNKQEKEQNKNTDPEKDPKKKADPAKGTRKRTGSKAAVKPPKKSKKSKAGGDDKTSPKKKKKSKAGGDDDDISEQGSDEYDGGLSSWELSEEE